MTRPGLNVAVIGCGLIGRKRAEALGESDRLIGAYDVVTERASDLVRDHSGTAYPSIEELLAEAPDVVVVAAVHDQLADLTEQALKAGAHVLVEKPAGISAAETDRLRAVARETGKRVKVGFNHRFHPGLMRLAQEVHSGEHGELMHLRGRYGHGGRPGYDREWRAEPARSGGGELIDQGMHLLDLTHWIAGPLPLHSALLRTQFWDTPVDDNAALLLGEADTRRGPWAMLHVTWTEWKNLFSIEVYCRTAKLQVDGLVRSYGPQSLKIYRMGPELGPPEVEELTYGTDDLSWTTEWEHFAAGLETGAELLGNLDDAHYAWSCVEAAYASSEPYAAMRAPLAD
ncbi:MAG TPA: Gfo/Idh/MocA family oxidoreductase [Solirubrobacteraceae bacterium]|jgi:predicted dehydrogenase|nr:Gfo/Idh/MocA family oxidoreductase [Solirubrobacteraceae bacterium]